MPQLVNLDALIPREDFEVRRDEDSPSELTQNIKVTDLEPGNLMYPLFRKPDFQRETSDWTPEKVAGLIHSFLVGDLIPALILWRGSSGTNLFVIDGAHRLGALIAWVHDDYGDGKLSLPFFEGRIPPEQTKAADATRAIVKRTVGSYEDLKFALNNQDVSTQDRVALARNVGAHGVKVQWVPGDARRAEKSFQTINQQQTPIDETERKMIENRRCPDALAARAMIRAGTGHKYWSSFSKGIIHFTSQNA